MEEAHARGTREGMTDLSDSMRNLFGQMNWLSSLRLMMGVQIPGSILGVRKKVEVKPTPWADGGTKQVAHFSRRDWISSFCNFRLARLTGMRIRRRIGWDGGVL